MKSVQVTGVGSEIPTRRITNQDWEKLVDTSDQWILDNLGIRERARIEANRTPADLGVAASRKALEMSALPADRLDFVLCATNSQADLFPSTASRIQELIGAERATAMDIQAGCTGWIYGMQLAGALVRSGEAERVLVVGTEALTRSLNLYDRSSSLFGDGSGACVVEHRADREPRRLKGIVAVTRTIPSLAMHHPTIYSEQENALELYLSRKDLTTVRRPLPVMDGKASLKLALTRTLEAVDEALSKAKADWGIEPGDIAHFIPHQTNVHIVRRFCEHVGHAFETIPFTLEKYGGISTAGIPTGLAEHLAAGHIKTGDLILVCGYGAGFTVGAMILEWSGSAKS